MPTISTSYKGYTVRTVYNISQNITANKSTISCTHYLDCASGWSLAISSRANTCVITGADTASQSFTSPAINTVGGTTITLGTTSHTVTHDSNGTHAAVQLTTTFNIKATISGVYKSSIIAAGAITLPMIARASTVATGNGTFGQPQTITITRASTSYVHTLQYSYNNTTWATIATNVATSQSWTPPLTDADHAHGGDVITYIRCITYYSGAEIGTKSINITIAVPSGLNPSCLLGVGDQQGYRDIYGDFVQGQSQFSIAADATPNQYTRAVITSYVLQIGGRSFKNNNGVFDMPSTVWYSGTMPATLTVTDANGNTARSTLNVAVLPYTNPAPTLTARRTNAGGQADDQGAYITASYRGTISPLNSLNTATCIIKYKKTSDTSYTTATASLNGARTFAADTGSSYDVVYQITDDFTTSSRAQSISTATTIMHIRADGTGVAFGKVSEDADCIEFGQDVRLNAGIFDKYDYEIRNGVAYYRSGGLADADSVREELILSSTNTPTTGFWYVRTVFYSNKDEDSNRAQIAIPYDHNTGILYRYFKNNVWSDWFDCATREFTAGDDTGKLVESNGHCVCWGKITCEANSQITVNFPLVFKYLPVISVMPQTAAPATVNWSVGHGTTQAAGKIAMVIYTAGSYAGDITFLWRAEGMING